MTLTEITMENLHAELETFRQYARRYQILRSCRGQEHDPNICVMHLDGNDLIFGDELDRLLDDIIEEEQENARGNWDR